MTIQLNKLINQNLIKYIKSYYFEDYINHSLIRESNQNFHTITYKYELKNQEIPSKYRWYYILRPVRSKYTHSCY